MKLSSFCCRGHFTEYAALFILAMRFPPRSARGHHILALTCQNRVIDFLEPAVKFLVLEGHEKSVHSEGKQGDFRVSFHASKNVLPPPSTSWPSSSPTWRQCSRVGPIYVWAPAHWTEKLTPAPERHLPAVVTLSAMKLSGGFIDHGL